MARYVKISTVGSPLIETDLSLPYAGAQKKAEDYLLKQIEQVLPDKPDLILMPEMCDVPTNYELPAREEYLRQRGDGHLDFFGKIARDNHCNLAFCTYRFGANDYTLNTLYALDRRGRVAGYYNKNHVVIPGESGQNIKCGVKAPLVELDIGKIACAICFDLNFDVIRNHYKALKPELILFSSMYHGGIVQQIWAQQCRAYFVGAICGTRPSAIISPMGEILAYSTNYTNYATATVNLDYALAHYDYNQDKFIAMKKKYGPSVKISEPGNIAYVMITSECEKTSAAEMTEEFGIQTLDDYLNGALAAHNAPENRCGEDE